MARLARLWRDYGAIGAIVARLARFFGSYRLLQVAGGIVVEVLADVRDDDAAGLFVEGEVEAQAVGASVVVSLCQVGLRVDGAALVGVLVLGLSLIKI